MKTIVQKLVEYQKGITRQDTGFSLLELVVAVSIMLILGVVGTTSYQAYTDNARQAAVGSDASKVLTSVLSADSQPNTTPVDELRQYNRSTNDMVANIALATPTELKIEVEDRQGTLGVATISGDYSHIDTTTFSEPGVSYMWTGDAHKSPSIKLLDGKEVARNEAPNPRAVYDNGWRNNKSGIWDRDFVTIDDHPLGITTAVQTQLTQAAFDNDVVNSTFSESMSLYDVGAMPRRAQEFYSGVWVKSTVPGEASVNTREDFVDIPANEWVFVTSDSKRSYSNSYGKAVSGVFVQHENTEEALKATTWTTGAVVMYSEEPVTEFFDGEIQ